MIAFDLTILLHSVVRTSLDVLFMMDVAMDQIPVDIGLVH
jgi:hypothetical protein